MADPKKPLEEKSKASSTRAVSIPVIALNQAPDVSEMICREVVSSQNANDRDEVAAALVGMKRKRDAADQYERRSLSVAFSDEMAADRSSSTATSEKDNSTSNEGEEDTSDSDTNVRGMTEHPDRNRIWMELLVERPLDTEGESMIEWLEKVVSASEQPEQS
ncbi:MAG: hypothetical protein SGILL_001454, partial [Bacillariaceae sp.]